MEHTFDLKHNGLKATAPRVKILELFRASDRRHLSAEDVYRLVLADDADLGLATVYRVLHQFEEAGLLKKSQLGNSKAVYELNDGERHHGHLVCTRTGDVKEFFDPVIEERLKDIATDLGFDLSDYVITAYGLSR